jgi:hypothetical protein
VTQGRSLAFVTREVLQTVRCELQKLAETRNANAAIPLKVTRPRAIRALRSEIAAVFKQGYEIADVLTVLNRHGIDIPTDAFREYWRQVKRRRAGSRNTAEVT